MNFAQAHELSHRMDILEYKAYENQEFKAAIKDAQNYVEENREEIQKLFIEGGKYYDNFAFSDIISALSDNKIKVAIGHPAWDAVTIRQEIFANLSVIDSMELDVSQEPIVKKLLEAYRKVVEK